jgi:protocatechuate 3,4-dioxygenase beta subunit
MHNSPSLVRAARVAAGLAVLALVAVPSLASAGPGDPPVTGVVFRDYDADGVRDSREPGEPSVAVRAVDAAGATTTTTSAADGTYSVDVTTLGAGPYRIEFDIPSASTWLAEGAHGANNGTSVQFVAAGGTASFAVQNPGDYCNANPRLVTTCFTGGDPLDTAGAAGPRSALKSFPYDATGQNNPAVTDDASAAEIGATWGIATDRASGDVFTSSLVKRHAGVGPGGVDAIYRVPGGNGTPVVWYTGSDTDGGTIADNATRGLAGAGTPSYDTDVFPLVGTTGWGDIDLSEDASTLYAVNLFDRSVVAINAATAVGAPLAAPNYPTCTNGVARPWGLAVHDGVLHLGVVCSGETGGTAADLSAQVLRYDIAAGTWGAPAFATPIPLDYVKGCSTGWFGVPQGCNWNPWTNTWDKATFAPFGGATAGSAQQRRISYPVPILSDIDFDDDGSMIIALMDRSGHQFGIENYAPVTDNSTTTFTVDIGGDLLRAAPPATVGGTYGLESGGSVAVGAGLGGGTIDSGAANNQGPGGGEFYRNDAFGGSHQETTEGGIVVVNGRGEVATNQMDPFAAHSAGTTRFSNITGATNGELQLLGNSTSPIGFGKANALGDLEAICELAPIEIGNRVWVDTDEDGVQDPSELPLAGVTVELFLDADNDGVADGPAFATAVTDAAGNYYFSSAAGTPVGPSEVFGLTQLVPGARVIVGVPTVTPAGVLTVPDTASPTAPDRTDSDANRTTGRTSTRTLQGAGRNDHSLDFGYVEPYSLGNLVWIDANNNGRIDAGENGVPNVTVELFAAGGTTPIATTTTDADGHYVFTGLPPGDYEVAITPPTGYRSSTGVSGSTTGPFEGPTTPDPDTDDDTDDNGTTVANGTVRSGPITLGAGAEPLGEPADGLTDPTSDNHANKTVDFGLFQAASLGDYVWTDTNRNGIQDEPPANGLNGVTVELWSPGPDGVAGTADDVQVGTTVTANDTSGNPGVYRFENLTPGDYYVKVPTLPPGTLLSPQDAGTNDAADSDLDPSTGRTIVTRLDPGENDPTWDIGISTPPPTVNLGDLVWIDANNNGRVDPGEPGIAGVTINLYRADGTTLVATTTTNDSGHYRFTGLEPGDYIVEIIPPSGYSSSTGTPGSPTGPYEGPGIADPDGDTNADDDGTTQPNGRIRSGIITLTVGTEPGGDDEAGDPPPGTGETDPAGNTTVDFGLFVTQIVVPPIVQPPAPQPPIASPPGGTLPTTGSTGLVNTLMLAGLSIGGGAILLRVRRRA